MEPFDVFLQTMMLGLLIILAIFVGAMVTIAILASNGVALVFFIPFIIAYFLVKEGIKPL